MLNVKVKDRAVTPVSVSVQDGIVALEKCPYALCLLPCGLGIE